MSNSPVFEAHFIDGTITRMTVHHTSLTRLDLMRAIKLANAAYQSRKHNPPVMIVAGRFEAADGTVLREYAADELQVQS
jgi:hypothetical protein